MLQIPQIWLLKIKTNYVIWKNVIQLGCGKKQSQSTQ